MHHEVDSPVIHNGMYMHVDSPVIHNGMYMHVCIYVCVYDFGLYMLNLIRLYNI